jgi:hypothetical protein
VSRKRKKLDRERTRKPRFIGGVRGAIKKEYIIRLRLPCREAPALWAGSFTNGKIGTKWLRHREKAGYIGDKWIK